MRGYRGGAWVLVSLGRRYLEKHHSPPANTNNIILYCSYYYNT